MEGAGQALDYKAFKFVRHKYSAIDTRTTVSYTEVSNEAEPFKFLITKQGLEIQGKLSRPLSNNADLQAFAKILSDAWKEHLRLAPDILQSATGH